MFALFLYLTIYMQGVLDYSPLEAGLRFLPLTVLGFIASPLAGASPTGSKSGSCSASAWPDRHRPPLHAWDLADSEWTTLLVGFLIAGIGVGVTNPGIGQAAIAVVPVEKSGMGSGINSTFRQVGIATGVAGLGAIFQSDVNSKLGELLPHAPKGLGEIVAESGSRGVAALNLPPALNVKATHAADIAFVGGFNSIILIAAILSFVGAALGFFLTRSSYFVQQTH